MGFYSTHVVPRLAEKSLGTGEIMKHRGHTCEGLTGCLVEIGFGSGLNVEKYPASVTHVYAVDPSEVARRLGAERIASSRVPIEFIGVDGQSLPLDDESCDSALSTYTLCTIPDVELALAEIMRVLRPGAPFHLLEHGLAREDRVSRWQHRLEPIQKRLGDGCHLTRDHDALLRNAGFEVDEVHEFYPKKTVKPAKPWSAFYRAVARKPAR
jgi:ubiquinone/menaquinone biosynthesis C-methylase UbiE